MVLKLFFDISTSFWFSENQCECTLHSEALLGLSKWIKVDKWDYFQNGSQDFFLFLFSFLILIYFSIYETTVRRSRAWSFGHSDPDPSSVRGGYCYSGGRVLRFSRWVISNLSPYWIDFSNIWVWGCLGRPQKIRKNLQLSFDTIT